MTTRPLPDLIEAVSKASSTFDVNALRMIEEELRDASDASERALAARTRGIIALTAEDHETALTEFNKALDLYSELGDHDGLMRTYGGIGTIWLQRANQSETLINYTRALDHAEKTGNEESIAKAFNNVGLIYLELGHYDRALESHNRALEIHERIGNVFGEAQAHENIGAALFQSGDFAGSLHHYLCSRDIFVSIDNTWGISRTMISLGALFHRLGKYEEAAAEFASAIPIMDQIGNVLGGALAKANLGNVFLELGDHDRALALMNEAIALQMSLKDVRGVVGTTCNLADLYLSMHDVTSAEAAMRSLDDWPITEPPLTARIALHKGNISLRNNDIDAAEAHFRHALEICRSTVLLMEQSTAYIGLQEVARNRNDLAKYIEYNTEQQRIKEQILGKETVLRIASQETERRIAAERQEREKERAVLYSTLPKNIADRIVRGERITGDQFEEAAVIFVDIVSFTKISAHMDASDVVDFLERLFSLFDAICKTHSITKIKTIGDSYMAVAFPESTRADDAPMDTPAMRAARASLDMLEGMGGFTQPENLRIRIGMHVGPVTAGVLGTERLQYDVWGDTVNVASRLESTSEPGRIHVSQQFADALTSNLAPGTWHAAHGTWHVALRGDTELKGKGTMTTYWLEPRGPFPAS